MDVAAWLQSLGLERYVPAFRDNEIDWDALPKLSAEDLKDLGVVGICERFHCTVLDEFYRVAFRKRIYRTIDELQADLDAWLLEYNKHRPHQGRWCFGKPTM